MRKLQPDDLLKVEYLTSPALSSSGTALYTVWTVDSMGRFVPDLWTVSEGSLPERLLSGSFHTKLARWSPAGNAIYFLSDKGTPGLYQIHRLQSGEDTCLTSLRHGVSWFSLSEAESSTRIAFECPVYTEDDSQDLFTPMTVKERCAFDLSIVRKPVEVTEIMYKSDSTYGIPDGNIHQIGILDTETGQQKLLTSDPWQHTKPVFSPDGKYLAFWSFSQSGWKKGSGQLSILSVSSPESVSILSGDIMALTSDAPVWMDSSTVLFSGYQQKDDALSGAFYKVNISDPEGPSLCWPSDAPCFGPGFMATGHTALDKGDQQLLSDSGKYCFLSASKSLVNIYSLDPEQEKVSRITSVSGCIQCFDVTCGKLLYVKGSPEHIGQLFLFDTDTGKETLLASHNGWMDDVQNQIPEEVWIPSSDGKVQIHGWIIKPADYKEGHRYPCVLDVHGGPECFYPSDWWFEFQYLAARGNAVVYCDPRGSISYGKEFQKGAWDRTAYGDLLHFLDYAISLGFIDEKRCGVTGGSYGGFMTNFIISHTDRFAAAVTQRNLCNRVTSYGTGDMGSILETPFHGCAGGFESRLSGDSTTIKWIDRVNTPLLILHATNDYRCSFEQGEQFFIAMKERRPDVPVRFAAFPGENHGLTREGNTYAQMGHLKEMADWFEKYLGKSQEAEA